LPISIDTSRALPAIAGLKAGASILNDVSGLSVDPALLPLLKHFKFVVLMANPIAVLGHVWKNPISDTKLLLQRALGIAFKNGVPKSRIILDPGIGFFRAAKIPWWKWDVAQLKNLRVFRTFGCPLMVGISRKSFIGHLLGGVPAEERLAGSLAATLFAVQNGASIVRTHDVKETKHVLQLADLFLKRSSR
jgi:dihydropteroate synthase